MAAGDIAGVEAAGTEAAISSADEGTRAASGTRGMAKRPAGAPRLVLAIDDDPDVIVLLRENLSDAGYRVVGAADGKEGLRKARALQPSAIILDIVMPETDGWQILHQLKSEPATRDIPVIMLTIVDQANLGFRLGAADYIVKPFERDALLATLGRVAPHGQRLLVVDDDPQQADLVRQLLEDDAYTIETAGDGQAALRAVAVQPPDAILLDLLMPHMDGFDVIDTLRQDARQRTIPVVVVTAKTLSSEEKRRLQAHTMAIIEKGALDRGKLIEELKQVLPEPAQAPGEESNKPTGGPRDEKDPRDRGCGTQSRVARTALGG
jgi:CheY-like chemotaxis protein